MRKFLALFVILCASLHLSAQSSPEKTHWFDGYNYYTSYKPQDGVYHFQGESADGRNKFSFYIKNTIDGPLVKEDENNKGFLPFRGGSYDSMAILDMVGGGKVFTIYDSNFFDDNFNVVWTLVQTTKSKGDCLASQLWHTEQPVEWNMKNMITNPYYLATLSKTQLRVAEESLYGRNRSDIEDLNYKLILTELCIPDYSRYKITDLDYMMSVSDYDFKVVRDAYEFLTAIQSGAKIKVADNATINLTDALNISENFRTSDRRWIGEAYTDLTRLSEPAVVSESVFNGRQLTIVNYENITIKGGVNSRIVVDPAYAFVLNFVNCTNITIENLTMGHTVEGYCTGGVIGLTNSSAITIKSCDLYGCGAYGIVSQESPFLMEKSIIRDCSYGIMQLYGVSYAEFNECDFFRNREFSMVEIDGNSSNIQFNHCRFAQNQGVLFAVDTDVEVRASEIHHPIADGFGSENNILIDESTGVFVDNEPLEDRGIGPQKSNSVY